MVAFASASGGSLFLGISDDGQIIGLDASNRMRNQVQDIANGSDACIPIPIMPHGQVIKIIVLFGFEVNAQGETIPNNFIATAFFKHISLKGGRR